MQLQRNSSLTTLNPKKKWQTPELILILSKQSINSGINNGNVEAVFSQMGTAFKKYVGSGCVVKYSNGTGSTSKETVNNAVGSTPTIANATSIGANCSLAS